MQRTSARTTVIGALAAGALAAGLLLATPGAWADPGPAPRESTPAPTASGTPSPAPSGSPSPTASPTASPSPTPTSPPPTPSPTRPTPSPSPTPTPTPPARQDTLTFPMRYKDKGAFVRVLQKRLTWLGYEIRRAEYDRRWFGKSTQRAVKAFQVKFFVDATGIVRKGTWNEIKQMSGTIGRLPRACLPTSLCVDKASKLLRYVRNGTVLLTLDARFGMSSTPTREGVFSVQRKSRNHYSSLYGSWMPFAMFFSGGQAVHYSPYFASDGYYGASHGCIGVRDFNRAEWLYDQVPIGMRVYVYWS